MSWFKAIHSKVLSGALHGGVKGAAAGAAASLVTGAAVIVTAPAWLPLVGSTAVVAGSTIALWSTVGSALGASVSGTRAYLQHKHDQEAFEKAFPPQNHNQD